MSIGKVIIMVSLLWFPASSFAQVPPHTTALPAVAAASPDAGQWDFGDIIEGETVKHSFVIKNDSQKTLTILKVNSSCGCTASEIKNKVLAPQESTTLDVSFNSSGYNGWTQQYIFVNTDDLQNPFLRYIIRANVAGRKNAQKKQ